LWDTIPVKISRSGFEDFDYNDQDLETPDATKPPKYEVKTAETLLQADVLFVSTDVSSSAFLMPVFGIKAPIAHIDEDGKKVADVFECENNCKLLVFYSEIHPKNCFDFVEITYSKFATKKTVVLSSFKRQIFLATDKNPDNNLFVMKSSACSLKCGLKLFPAPNIVEGIVAAFIQHVSNEFS
jgi:hypothetical protein